MRAERPGVTGGLCLPLAVCLLALASAAVARAASDALPPDPLDSPQWGTMAEQYFGDAPVRFDERVVVRVPAAAEDPMNVPVSVRAEEIDGVEEILVFVDLNPIPKVLSFRPEQGRAYLAFRIKLQQSSPVRAAVRTGDGTWHLGGAWTETGGGGCTLPSAGRASSDWVDHLGEVHARRWPRAGGERVRIRVMHPMDTGLAEGIPAFYLERLELRAADGRRLGSLSTFEPLQANPVFSLELPSDVAEGPLSLRGVDNNGNRVEALIPR